LRQVEGDGACSILPCCRTGRSALRLYEESRTDWTQPSENPQASTSGRDEIDPKVLHFQTPRTTVIRRFAAAKKPVRKSPGRKPFPIRDYTRVSGAGWKPADRLSIGPSGRSPDTQLRPTRSDGGASFSLQRRLQPPVFPRSVLCVEFRPVLQRSARGPAAHPSG
jgi:hypothetical protein